MPSASRSKQAARSRTSSKRRVWTSSAGWTPEPTSATPSSPGPRGESEPEVHEDYVSAYDLGRFAESARFVRHYPEQNPALRDLPATITTPTQIVAGRDDDLVPWSNNQYLDDRAPTARSIPSTPVTSRGSKQRRNTAA